MCAHLLLDPPIFIWVYNVRFSFSINAYFTLLYYGTIENVQAAVTGILKDISIHDFQLVKLPGMAESLATMY
jgi:hypothetical protein